MSSTPSWSCHSLVEIGFLKTHKYRFGRVLCRKSTECFWEEERERSMVWPRWGGIQRSLRCERWPWLKRASQQREQTLQRPWGRRERSWCFWGFERRPGWPERWEGKQVMQGFGSLHIIAYGISCLRALKTVLVGEWHGEICIGEKHTTHNEVCHGEWIGGAKVGENPTNLGKKIIPGKILSLRYV